ncbi:MAG: hypothetical protein H7Z37_15095 [Pyrinomonadaceae bacterium]|nr:hypothetical protein [Pyrinomonadaceae bacterium]
MENLESERNRRKHERLEISLPINVYCRESKNETWEEVTRLIDVTPFGAGFVLPRFVEIGRLLQLTMPLPRQLRCYDHLEPMYKVWCVVRYLRSISQNVASPNYILGVAFIGKRTPASFEENPRNLYEAIETNEGGFMRIRVVAPKIISVEDKPPQTAEEYDEPEDESFDARTITRHPIPLSVTIEVFDEHGTIIAEEQSATENISNIGASVFTTLEIERGRFVRMTCEQMKVSLVSIVRSRKTGADNLTRLHLEFIDREFPIDEI